MRSVSAVGLLALMVACKPAYPPPPGFEEACYGGDFRKHLDRQVPVLTVRIKANEQQWTALSNHLRAFAGGQRLSFFDTTLYLEHVHALGLSVCSSDGVDISVNEQHWKQGYFKDKFDPNHVNIRFYRYKDYKWHSLGDDLVKHLQQWDPDAAVQYSVPAA
jgi:hypothetical protein